MAGTVLNWAIVALSLTNTILMFWLAFTVFVNAERRTWGVWVMSGGFAIGGVFFVSHTAILGHGLTSFDPGMTLWWHLGLSAVLALPFLGYVVLLWYAGFWEDKRSPLYRRQRVWFVLNALATIGLSVLLVFANPFPSYEQVIVLDISATPSVRGIPLLIVLYVACSILSMALSLDAVLRPGPSRRMMGDLARRRARPWLVAACVLLLTVSLLVAIVMVWVVFNAAYYRSYGTVGSLETSISWFDMIISGLIATAVIFLGQAIVRYEVFTGKTLPQRRFRRHWRNIVILALGFGMVMSAALEFAFHPIYVMLLMAILTTLFYGLFSQNSYAEREQYIRQLRPFVLSQRLYDHLVTGSVPADIDVSVPFYGLCRDVLGARRGYLFALGPVAPLVGPPLAYPEQTAVPKISSSVLTAQFSSPQVMCIQIDPLLYGGAAWAVSLWSERGLIGMLLLGEKSNGGLYTQEEIEIARASGERLIDTQASAEMARRLMGLQRQRLAESQVVDRRVRRILHDDVLPRIHTAMLALSGGESDLKSTATSTVQQLSEVHRQIADVLHEMPALITPVLAQSGLFAALRKALDEELGVAFDSVEWQIQPAAEDESRTIPSLTAEVLYYAAREAVRNAARHGRGKQDRRPLRLQIQATWHDGLELCITDDGVGLTPTVAPTDSQTGGEHAQETESDPSSRLGGRGLALHSTMLAVVGGSLAVESAPGQFTRVSLLLPREAWAT